MYLTPIDKMAVFVYGEVYFTHNGSNSLKEEQFDLPIQEHRYVQLIIVLCNNINITDTRWCHNSCLCKGLQFSASYCHVLIIVNPKRLASFVISEIELNI